MIWIKPSGWREIVEFLRIIGQLKLLPHVLVWKYLRGQMVELDDETWKNLKDTDSWRTTDMREVESVRADRQDLDFDPYPVSSRLRRAFGYEPDPEDEYFEAFWVKLANKLRSALCGDSPPRVLAPIAIRLPCGDVHLVSGNRRLMLARASGVRPMCFLL
jgi:hypothetical protein